MLVPPSLSAPPRPPPLPARLVVALCSCVCCLANFDCLPSLQITIPTRTNSTRMTSMRPMVSAIMCASWTRSVSRKFQPKSPNQMQFLSSRRWRRRVASAAPTRSPRPLRPHRSITVRPQRRPLPIAMVALVPWPQQRRQLPSNRQARGHWSCDRMRRATTIRSSEYTQGEACHTHSQLVATCNSSSCLLFVVLAFSVLFDL